MKATLLLMCFIFFCLPSGAQINKYHSPENPRVEKNINKFWTFNYFPEQKGVGLPGFEMPGYDDSKWPCIALPHTWQTYESTHELHPYIRSASADDDPYWWKGWGCYRKHIVIGKEYEGKIISFEFDGVQKYSKVFLNGKYLGDHKGGYTSFYVDATEAVKFGDDNLLAVAVNNEMKDPFSIPPMSAGNFDVYGGIHRDVRLLIRERLNIPFQGSWQHEGGTFITTPKVNDEEAEVAVKTYIRNDYQIPKNVRLVTVLTDSAGFVIERLETTMKVESGQITEFVQKPAHVKNPHLWSPETPYLYKAWSEVYDRDRLTDCYYSTFGIRTFYWDFDTHRLILNGKTIHLHGINRHEEYIWLGSALPKWIAERDMSDIANGLEVNFMRTAHYPNDPLIYDFTDRNGICINEELPNIKKLEFSDEVQEQNCREMIRRDRNHPSILFWSMGNETTDACDSRIAWEEDTTRILTVRQPYNESYNPLFVKHSDKEMPLESFLRCTIRGWYDKDDKNLEPDDNQWTGTEEWQHSQSAKSIISEHNGAVWLYADHGADREYVNAPLKHVNPKGWVDSWRTPKYAYYQWQANFAKKPMVFIHPHFWRRQYLGEKKDFIVDSNCREVELFVNGKSKGILNPEKSNNYCVNFRNIEVEEGILEAIANCADGTKIIHRLVMAGEPALLTIIPTASIMYSSPDNITELKVDIKDSNGIHVYAANNTLKFTVDGPARLVGPAVYISDHSKNEEYEGTMYIDAPVTNLIRATGKTGSVRVTVSSTGLKPAFAEIAVIADTDRHPFTGIAEPPVLLEGREPIAINLGKANFIKAPVEMKNYTGEIRFPISQKDQYRQLIRTFILKENPGIGIKSLDFGYVLDAMVAILNSTGKYNSQYAYIVADDYNFVADQYNLSRAITKIITSKRLPPAFKNELAAYYAGQIIGGGKDKNFSNENDLINRIPEGGKAVVIAEKGNLKDVIYDSETNLLTLLQKIYPRVAGYKKDDLKKMLSLVERINPYITFKNIRDKNSGESMQSYIIERGRIILIPDEYKLLKTSFPDRKI